MLTIANICGCSPKRFKPLIDRENFLHEITTFLGENSDIFVHEKARKNITFLLSNYCLEAGKVGENVSSLLNQLKNLTWFQMSQILNKLGEVLVNENHSDVFTEATYAFLNLVSNSSDFALQLSQERLLIQRMISLLHIDSFQLRVNILKIFISITGLDGNPNIQNFIGEIELSNNDNNFIFTMHKMLSHKNSVFSYLSCMILSNICQLGVEFNFQISKNRVFEKMIFHCIDCIMKTDLRLVLRKEMIMFLNNYILNSDYHCIMFLLRIGLVKALYHILDTYNYAVDNNCAINYNRGSLNTPPVKNQSVSGQEKVIKARNDIFYTALSSMKELLLAGSNIKDVLNQEEENSQGRNPVIIELKAENLDFKFLRDRYNIICESINKNTTDELIEEFFNTLLSIEAEDMEAEMENNHQDTFERSEWQ